jgi:hypothetical protein
MPLTIPSMTSSATGEKVQTSDLIGAAVKRKNSGHTPAADEQARAQQHGRERAGNDGCPDDLGLVLAAQPLLDVGRHWGHQDQA